MVQCINAETRPQPSRSLFMGDRWSLIQVNETPELRADLKTVEPSYTSAPCHLKSRITCKWCFTSMKDTCRQPSLHRNSQNVLFHTPRDRWYRQQELYQSYIDKGVT